MDSVNLHQIAALYAGYRGISLARVSNLVSKNAYLFKRLSQGSSCTLKTHNRALQWFSDHWPADLPWPPDIPRPAPSPDSPTAQSATKERPALQLSAKGQIRRPAALCELLSIDLAIYYQATSQYAQGRPRADKAPRKGSGLAALVAALALLGDRRFVSRREMAQLAMAMPGSVLRQRLAPLLEAA